MIRACQGLEKDFGIVLADKAECVAGHSLGEYSALCAAGAFSLTDTAKLLRLRGIAMQDAVPIGVGAMAALLGADIAKASALAEAAAVSGARARAGITASVWRMASCSAEVRVFSLGFLCCCWWWWWRVSRPSVLPCLWSGRLRLSTEEVRLEMSAWEKRPGKVGASVQQEAGRAAGWWPE